MVAVAELRLVSANSYFLAGTTVGANQTVSVANCSEILLDAFVSWEFFIEFEISHIYNIGLFSETSKCF